MPRKKSAEKSEAIVKQGAKFGLVGISNTIIDYTIFIALSNLLAVPLDKSFMVKYVSGSVAMINSFYWNRRWTFHSKAGIGRSGVRFLVATLVSIWAIQPGLVWLISGTDLGQAFGSFWYDMASLIGLTGLLPNTITEPFVIKTVGFGVGVVGSAIWNFTLYKLWAFKEN